MVEGLCRRALLASSSMPPPPPDDAIWSCRDCRWLWAAAGKVAGLRGTTTKEELPTGDVAAKSAVNVVAAADFFVMVADIDCCVDEPSAERSGSRM